MNEEWALLQSEDKFMQNAELHENYHTAPFPKGWTFVLAQCHFETGQCPYHNHQEKYEILTTF